MSEQPQSIQPPDEPLDPDTLRVVLAELDRRPTTPSEEVVSDLLAKLRIPDGTARSNATGRKCRGASAVVLSITGSDGTPCHTAISRRFRVWYSHQFPGKPWEQEVSSPQEGKAILEAIYNVMLFMFTNRMIPDYANAGGVSMTDDDGDWVDYDPHDEDEWAEMLEIVSAGGAQ